jgi:predicted  nucleic acid-binding Zn-ribbon protein
MSDDNAQVTQGTETAEEVGRIRDILFGHQMRDYQQRFDALRRDLERLQGELDRFRQQLADQDADQGKKLGSLRQEARDADEALRGELRETAAQLSDQKTDRAVLAELLIQLGADLKGGRSFDGILKSLGGTAKD